MIGSEFDVNSMEAWLPCHRFRLLIVVQAWLIFSLHGPVVLIELWLHCAAYNMLLIMSIPLLMATSSSMSHHVTMLI